MGSQKLSPPDIPSDVILEQYAEISKTLLCCEASSTLAGIPWLPPTARVARLKKQYHQPLREFLRASLSNVATGALESFVEDLEASPADDKALSRLDIKLHSECERYALAVLAVVCCGLFSYFFFPLVTASASLAIFLSFITLLGTAALSIFLSSDYYRKQSFYCLLLDEIMRRRGISRSKKSSSSKWLSPGVLNSSIRW